MLQSVCPPLAFGAEFVLFLRDLILRDIACCAIRRINQVAFICFIGCETVLRALFAEEQMVRAKSKVCWSE